MIDLKFGIIRVIRNDLLLEEVDAAVSSRFAQLEGLEIHF
jgi:hypothetical protein